jgi:hypothetical protein
MPKLPKEVIEIGKKYNLDSSVDLWDCQGTWVVTHKALERIAAQENIQWHRPPEIVCSDTDSNVVLVAYGKLGDREEWSTGEASSDNYPKRGRAKRYPWAIAEKRAKDRVILKLINLAGYLYSEEESEEFKDARPAGPEPKPTPRGEVSALGQGEKTNREVKATYDKLLTNLNLCRTSEDLSDWKNMFGDEYKDLPEDYRESMRGECARKKESIEALELAVA